MEIEREVNQSRDDWHKKEDGSFHKNTFINY